MRSPEDQAAGARDNSKRRENRGTQYLPAEATVSPIPRGRWINRARRHQIARTKDTG